MKLPKKIVCANINFDVVFHEFMGSHYKIFYRVLYFQKQQLPIMVIILYLKWL